jgi:hypothetical protein
MVESLDDPCHRPRGLAFEEKSPLNWPERDNWVGKVELLLSATQEPGDSN